MTKYRSKPVEVQAMQFDGTEESARTLIEWGLTLQPPIHFTRYLHRGSWNDSEPELWLRLNPGSGTALQPTDWALHDGHKYAEVWGSAGFEEEYERLEP